MNTIQSEICSMWANLLGCDAVAPNDDFFEIGGTSLMALKLVHTIKTKYSANIDLEAFFESPTVEALAAMVSSLPGAECSNGR